MLPNSEKDFIKRHIGPSKEDQSKMLKELNYQSIDDLMNNTVPEKIMFKGELNIGESNSEYEALRKLRAISKKNHDYFFYRFIFEINVFNKFVNVFFYIFIFIDFLFAFIIENRFKFSRICYLNPITS